ncbi:cysteine--tRNA ligase [Aerosticca soli]|jgi:cysteinyl-tRNA synthetase|uniref:Cysteine--tRNA ligase n=1 Tax=Aerosticca soli TaxID=2010829 RepID=A0A2Z6E4M0_9GAMM|nr:cysteine--tRNA ligase [Aerosticca soli]MDI3261685.1 cysteine--tRNA ligase [Fulvimonas sp.]BBD79852.1 cysteinyl-tRNA synthetase [Aerosticca soli]
MPLRLHDSLRRQTLPFVPGDPSRVTLYLCGPTVYHYVHIGNARGPVVFDVLVRLLRRRYPRVVYARNVTDVDDKINAAAQAAGLPIGEITRRYAAIYHEDMAALGVAPPDVEPYATEHIGPIIAMIDKLIAGGHAYVAEGHVLFDVASYPDYGRLSGRNVEELIAGARVEVAPYKRNPADFVLWKPSPPELPGWDSPWGRGRPGWHIECSAMSEAHLGETIDIHAGGVDLLFPHHENEIAQSTCAHGGKTFARWWLHNGMLTFEGAKMSKSLGNIERVHDLLQRHPAEALRYALLSAHYRQPLEWSDALVEQSRRTLDRLYGTLRDLGAGTVEAELPEDIEAALEDDLNTPAALAALNEEAARARQLLTHARQPDGSFAPAQQALLARAKARLLGGGHALGLLQQDPQDWFRPAVSELDTARIEALVAERQAARAARDFARADAIRQELATLGVTIEDGPQGTRWSLSRRA